MKVGVIGTGRIGRLHIENILLYFPFVKIGGVFDINKKSLQQTASRFKIAHVFDNADTLLNDASIKALLICSSTDTHAQLIKKAAEKKKHVFCEKPIDLHPQVIDEVLKIVHRYGIKFQVGFNRRFDRNFQALKNKINQGIIGTPHILKITSRDPEPPPGDYILRSGGLFKDMMIHDFDMLRFLLDTEVEEVFALGTARIYTGEMAQKDIDTAVVTLRCKNASICVIDNSRQSVYGYDQRVEVFGSRGNIVARNEYPNTLQTSTVDGVWNDAPLYFFLDRYRDSYREELRMFFHAVEHDQAVSVNGYDGRQPVYIAQAALQSLTQKRSVMLHEVDTLLQKNNG
ncbi:hypothetical protein LSH36_2111g00005 [Paralvinella palmiformis]|uniref:Inositol 2-dehydrogenase n=1 Tax=Paralvinella palmiformis TaxID=53620 RepID=A0AAD9MM64_9ANNE|nr:hypothetical protein LSH36_2111g00005 [Paralvinella palmiformis]